MPRSHRTETPETADMQDVGRIYVLANRDQSLAKVGMTRTGTPPALARVATSSRRRHRYGRMLSRLFSWWLASRRHRTFR